MMPQAGILGHSALLDNPAPKRQETKAKKISNEKSPECRFSEGGGSSAKSKHKIQNRIWSSGRSI
jgi:hypothetical protein